MKESWIADLGLRNPANIRNPQSEIRDRKMNKKFIVIVYDISNDRRRTKLHNALLDFGSPVQYSVFECLLNEKNEKRMRKVVSKIIRPKADQVRFYTLCAECVARAEITSGPAVLHEEQSIIV